MSRMLDGARPRPPALRASCPPGPASRRAPPGAKARGGSVDVNVRSSSVCSASSGELVGIERTLHGRSHAGWSGVGRSAVQRWQRDVAVRRWTRAYPRDDAARMRLAPLDEICPAGYSGIVPRPFPSGPLGSDKRGAPPHRSAEDRPDDLDRDDHHEVGDGHRGEESERGAPGVPARDRPRPVGCGHDQVGHDAADDQDKDDVDGDRARVRRSPPGSVAPAAERHVVGDDRAMASTTATLRLAATARTTRPRGVPELTPADLRPRSSRGSVAGSRRSVIPGRGSPASAAAAASPACGSASSSIGFGDAVELVVRREEANAQAECVEARRWSGRWRSIREPSSSSAACAGQPAMRIVTRVAIA